MDDIISFEENADVPIYGLDVEVGSFSTNVATFGVSPSVLSSVRDRVDSLVAKHWSGYKDGFIVSDADADMLADHLDAINQHEWVGRKSDITHTVHRPLDAIAAISAGPVLDCGETTILARISRWNAMEARRGYYRIGDEKEDKLKLPKGRVYPDLIRGVKYLEDIESAINLGVGYHSVFLGTQFHVKISKFEDRHKTLALLQDLRFQRAYFVFPDPLGFAYKGFLSRRETDNFSVEMCYPESENAIDGALDIVLGGKRYFDPLIKKRSLLQAARTRGLDVLFFRADQFVDSVFVVDRADYDRLILQNYCVGVFKPRATPLCIGPLGQGSVHDVYFRQTGVKRKARLPSSAKGMPLPRHSVPHYVMGDVYVADKLDGVPFWAYLEGNSLVCTVEKKQYTIKALRDVPLAELEVYGEYVEQNGAGKFIIYDVYSINNELNLPFYERWAKLQYFCRKWPDIFPGVHLQEFALINSLRASHIISHCHEGIVLVLSESIFGSFKVDGKRMFQPVRYVKRVYTVDVRIEKENMEKYKWTKCKFAGEGVYEVDASHTVIRRHPEEHKKPNGQLTILTLSQAAPFEYFVAFRDSVMLSQSLEKVLDIKDPKWYEAYSSLVVYLTYPAPYTYLGFDQPQIILLEKLRAVGFDFLMKHLAAPEPAVNPPEFTLDSLVAFVAANLKTFNEYSEWARTIGEAKSVESLRIPVDMMPLAMPRTDKRPRAQLSEDPDDLSDPEEDEMFLRYDS